MMIVLMRMIKPACGILVPLTYILTIAGIAEAQGEF